MLNTINRVLEPVRRSIRLLVSRAIVRAIDDTTDLQELQISLMKGEVRGDVERFQNYGFSSVPLEGAEAVTVFVGGDRSHGIVLAVDDRRHRLKNMAAGESAMYSNGGYKIHIKQNGDIEVIGGITTDRDIIINGKSFLAHTHTETGGTTGPPL